MIRTVFLVAVSCCFAVGPALAEPWAEAMFEQRSHDFGVLARDASAVYRFELTNKYVEDIHVASARSSCGCTIVEVEKPSLKTHEKGAIVARINTKAFRGARGATITVTLDQPSHAVVQLNVRANIREDVVFNPGSVRFESVEQGQSAERFVAVSRLTREDWQVVRVNTSNPCLTAEVVSSKRNGPWMTSELRVRLNPDAPAGYVKDHLVLIASDQPSRGIPLEVEGRIQPVITLSPASLFMGVVRPGESVTKKLVVQGREPFRITSVHCGDQHFQFSDDAGDQPKPLHVIPITFVASDLLGKVEQTIHIETDWNHAASELSTYAVVAQ